MAERQTVVINTAVTGRCQPADDSQQHSTSTNNSNRCQQERRSMRVVSHTPSTSQLQYATQLLHKTWPWVTAVETVQSEDSKREEMCQQLNLPQEIRTQASAIWRQLHDSGLAEFQTDDSSWFACLLYVAVINARLPYGLGDPQAGTLTPPCMTVTDLLTAADIKILDFFHKLRVIRESQQLSEAVVHAMTNLKRNYLITCPLFTKFEKMFGEIFRTDEAALSSCSNEDDASTELETFEGRKKFCWLLFILAKGLTLGGSLELVLAFHLLLCCLDFVVRMTPSFQLRPPFDAARITGAENTPESAVLKQLCEKFDANLDELKMVWTNYLQPVVNDLPQSHGSVDVSAVATQYHKLYRQNGDLDEMLFFDPDSHLVISRESNNNEIAPVDVAAVRPVPHQTPVRAVMCTVQQLGNLLESCGDEPSSTLKRYFQNCAVDPSPAISQRIQELEGAFLQGFSLVTGDNVQQIAKRRFQLAVRLHYRVMEALLKQEEARLSLADFSRLLNNAVFHKCLLACAMEVVLMVYGANAYSPNIQSLTSPSTVSPATAFPWILGVFNLHADDFLKVLGSFVKAEPKLTRDAVRHLQQVEHQIVEELGWKTGSPVFDFWDNPTSSQTSSGHNQPASNSLLDTPGALTNTSPADLYLSPVRPRNNRTHSPGSSTVAEPGANLGKSHSLNLFLNTACRLGYHRMQALCSRLCIPKDLQQKIWTCLEHCITQQPLLMKNRHLDQIMLCCVYAICKVSEMEREVRFKTIVFHYKSLPGKSQQVYKQVRISDNDFDTIIKFYNTVFMQTLKSYILQFSSNKVPTLSPLPKSPCHASLTASPVYALPGKKNFFISPLKTSPFKSHLDPGQMTPRSQQLYSFGEVLGSAEKLKVINDAMREAQGSGPGQPVPSSQTQKRIKFDKQDDFTEYDDNHVAAALMSLRRKQPSQSRKCLSFAEPNSGSHA